MRTCKPLLLLGQEVEEGLRVGGYMKPVLIAAATDEPAAEAAQASAFSPLPRDSRDPNQHHGKPALQTSACPVACGVSVSSSRGVVGTMSKCKYVYHGRHSEGNRFIRNNDL